MEQKSSVLAFTLAVLKLPHLFHSTDYFLLILDDLRLIVRLVDDLDRGHVSVVRLIILEFDVIGQ